MKLHRAVMLSVTLANATVAQAVLRVGPGQPFADVQAAINAARPGDVVEADSGTYPPFTLTKALKVLVNPQSPNVTASYFSTMPGVPVLIQGFRFSATVTVSATLLSLQDCTFTWGCVASSADVHMTRCTVGSGGGGQSVQAAFEAQGTTTLTGVQSQFQGAFSAGNVPDGIWARQQSRLHLNACSVTGGQYSFRMGYGGDGVVFDDMSTGWLADCTVTAGPGGSPGLAIRSSSTASPAVVDRCTLNGASSTFGYVNGPLAGISSGSVLAVGAPLVIDVHTRAGFAVGFHVSLTLSAPMPSPLLAEPEWGFLASSTLVALGIADPMGLASNSIQVPNNPVLRFLPVWFCAWSGQGFPLQLTTPLARIVL